MSPSAGTILVVDEPLIFRPARAEDALEDDPLRDWFVWWDQIAQSDLDSFFAALEQATDEQDRAFAVTALTQCAVTAARWSRVLGISPITVAFPGGSE